MNMIVKINAAATNAASTVSSSVSMPRGLDTSRAPCPDDHVGSTVTSSPDMVFFAAISGGAATGTGAAATCARSITRVCDCGRDDLLEEASLAGGRIKHRDAIPCGDLVA